MPEIQKAARKEASGVARINLDNGKVESLNAEQIAAGKHLPIPSSTPMPKVGILTLTLKDESAKNPKNLRETTHPANAERGQGRRVAARDRSPMFLPPLP